ncbi:MAG: hypothetical protein H6574_17145 [Lewinellaceae bacterium]|nr:hypothetical protein [Lewinellaceae bacterium]
MRVRTTRIARTGGRYRWKEGAFAIVQSGKGWRNYRWVTAQITAVGCGGNYWRLGILRPGVGDADFISRIVAAIGVVSQPGLRVRATRIARTGGRYCWKEGALRNCPVPVNVGATTVGLQPRSPLLAVVEITGASVSCVQV